MFVGAIHVSGAVTFPELSAVKTVSQAASEAEGDGYYIREFDLENDLGTLLFFQKEVGEVNCVVYDAALVLGKYVEKKCLEDENYVRGRRIIELGAGLGCVGLVAAAYGGDVLLTDLPKALPQLELNVRRNRGMLEAKGGTTETKVLDWNSEENPNLETFDLVLAADCIYYKEGVPVFINTLLRLSGSETEILLSQENRAYSETQREIWKYFCEEVLKHFKVKIIPMSQHHEDYRSADIHLLHLTVAK